MSKVGVNKDRKTGRSDINDVAREICKQKQWKQTVGLMESEPPLGGRPRGLLCHSY